MAVVANLKGDDERERVVARLAVLGARAVVRDLLARADPPSRARARAHLRHGGCGSGIPRGMISHPHGTVSRAARYPAAARYPTRHDIPRGMVSRTARYPARHGIPRGTVSRTARYRARHGIPHGMVSRTARYRARHGIPHGMVSRTAWYPARHGIAHGMVSRTAWYPTWTARRCGTGRRSTAPLWVRWDPQGQAAREGGRPASRRAGACPGCTAPTSSGS